jgi:FlaA1/EpsC-like NDP-sugar epimerase
VFEELFAPNERYRPTPHQHVFIAERVEQQTVLALDEALKAFEAVVQANDDAAARSLLKQLVPEYTGADMTGHAVP